MVVTSRVRRSSGQQQHRVAELVPEVRRRVRRGDVGVGPVDQVAGRRPPRAGARWLASGSCRPVSRPPTTRRRSLRAEHQRRSSPALGTTRPPRRRRLQRADHGRADRDDPAAGAGVASTSRAVAAGTAYSSGWAARASPGSRPRCAARSGRRRRRAPSAAPAVRSVSGRPALGISALPGWVGVDVLQRRRRPVAVDVR